MSFSLPPEITQHWIEATIALLGIILGWIIARFSSSSKITFLNERIHEEQRRATDLQARLSHASAEARHHAQQAQSFASRLANEQARAGASAEESHQLAQILPRLEKRIASVEHAGQFVREEMHSRISAIEQFLRGAKPAAPPPVPQPKDFSFVPNPPANARSAADDLRSALD